jgi:hypothetical protein
LFYLADNGVTVLCPAAAVGDTGVVDGVTYTKRDRAALDALVAPFPTDEVELARSCTTGVTNLSELFGDANGGSKVSDPSTFNPDLSSWDVSSVTDMTAMFRVRVPPSRVLLRLSPCRRRPSPIPSLRHHCSRHTAARPSLRCRLPLPSISPSVIGT